MSLLYLGVNHANAHDGAIAGGHHMMSYGGGYGFVGYFAMIIFWLGVVGIIIYLVAHLSSQKNNANSDSAINILKERYAKGEINKDEFEAKKKDLK